MNDAHIYCAPDQVMAELRAVLAMHAQVYRILDLRDHRVRLSTRGPRSAKSDKFVDDPAGWERAEAMLRRVLVESEVAFFEGPSEAAFYGPKIDFQFRMVTGREETASTLQLDFASAKRLDLVYVGPSGENCPPVILHRAPLGTHERFVALLIERFAGAFPTWLAPRQVRVLPVSAANEAYAREVVASLRALRIRADLHGCSESLGRRIRQAARLKIPHTLVVGEKEQADRSVTLRRFGSRAHEALSLRAFEGQVARAIASRSLVD